MPLHISMMAKSEKFSGHHYIPGIVTGGIAIAISSHTLGTGRSLDCRDRKAGRIGFEYLFG